MRSPSALPGLQRQPELLDQQSQHRGLLGLGTCIGVDNRLCRFCLRPARPRLCEAVDEDSISPSDADGHTAIYDIAARTVYLPNGRKLEAHSGLGRYLDDPRYVTEKDRGPTPPNLYNLSLREEPFHGVRAIRLIPVGGGNMFGRDGMLAHSYMLGPNGQSNGCVSLSDYSAFLNAFLSGDINRLVVVEHLATAAFKIQRDANIDINTGKDDWFDRLLDRIAECRGDTRQVIEPKVRGIISRSEAIRYVQLGNPESILIGDEKIEKAVMREYGVADA
jgi:hypothetical protein